MSDKFDLYIFGSTSVLLQHLINTHKDWFLEHTNHLYLMQRTATYPDVYKDFKHTAITVDCSDFRAFGAALQKITSTYATSERLMHVFPTYGKFTWNFAEKGPVFTFSDDGYQINLVSRLQILEAFRPYARNTRFHLMGSLFAHFPYTGDYGLSMWYVNQLPKNADYADLHINVYNVGGCKTRFWDWQRMKNNPFLHDELPTDKLFEHAFLRQERGVRTFYPSLTARIAFFLGARGVRVL